MMEKFFVIANVNGENFMIKLEANSAAGAEHKVFDLGYCGKHEYGVQCAMAFDFDAIKTDTFANMALESEMVSFETLTSIIIDNNNRIKAREEAKRELAEKKAELEALKAQIAELEKAIA